MNEDFQKKAKYVLNKFLHGASYVEPQPRSRPDLPPVNDCVYWGGYYVPLRDFAPHSLLIGAPGSGKTWLLRMLMRSALLYQDEYAKPPRPIPGKLKSKAVIYDGGTELIHYLDAIGIPKDRVYDLNPFHEGSYRWDLAKDITDSNQANHAAEALFPDSGERGENSFFPEAARGLLAATMQTFIAEKRTDWTMYELFSICSDVEVMRRRFPKYLHLLAVRTVNDNYLNLEERALTPVMANVTKFIRNQLPVACLYEHTALSTSGDRSISLSEWVKDPEPSVLIISRRPQAGTVLDNVNRMLFACLFDQLLNPELLLDLGSAQSQVRLWMFLDEVHLAGRLNFLGSILTNSRKFGARAALAFQDIHSLYKPELYGEAGAQEITSMCGNVAGLRVETKESADWLANRFGEHEAFVTSYNQGTSLNHDGKEGSNEGVSRSPQKQHRIKSFWFQNHIPITSPQAGLTGAFRITGADNLSKEPRNWQKTLTSDEVDLYGGEGEAIRLTDRPPEYQEDPNDDARKEAEEPSKDASTPQTTAAGYKRTYKPEGDNQ